MASELAESMGVTRANITNLLTGMMAKDLIVQVEDKNDRRIKRLTLTEKGEAVIVGLQQGRQVSNQQNLKGFSEEEKKQFLSFLQRTTHNIMNT